ncbi:MAG: ATP-binding protein [Bryobacteraceae bacterium]|jgi:serine/threonine-protein kinase RsbW
MILLDQRLESSLESVDHTEQKTVALAQESGFSAEETYRLGYAVREALVNAVVHGNRYSANKAVHFKVTRTPRGIEVVIEDQGSGFIAEMQGDPLAQENLMNQSGRGLALIRAFTDELLVERTAQGGTRVILRKFLPPEAR